MPNKRRNRAETQALMLEAGVDVLRRDGVRLGAATFTYSDAFALLQDERDIKVTRGSVHERIWSTQEAWQLDVLTESIERNETGRRTVVDAAVTARIGELPHDTADERRLLLAECFRVGSLTFADDIVAHPEHRMFPVVIAAWKASANTMPEFERLGQMLTSVQAAAFEDLCEATTALFAFLRFDVPRRGLSLEEAIHTHCTSATALAYSHTLRSPHDPAITARVRARCPDGEYREWNHLGLALWLITLGLFDERAPDAVDDQGAPS